MTPAHIKIINEDYQMIFICKNCMYKEVYIKPYNANRQLKLIQKFNKKHCNCVKEKAE